MRKKFKKILLACFFQILIVSMLLPIPAVCAEEPAAFDGYYRGGRERKTVWGTSQMPGEERAYAKHRIPGIVVTKKDTVIIYCEARTGDTSHSLTPKDDWCLMDIYLQRSTDGGKTFGEPIYISRGNNITACINNPTIIVGNDNTLHMLYCKNYTVQGGGLWYRKSTDDGLTWTAEKNISKFTKSVPHACFAFGPTHGICTRDGVLMVPVWLVPDGESRYGNITEHGPSKAYVFYSKDNGETWALSEAASSNASETNIVELSNGDILLNSRSTPYRKITVSPNGINRWMATYADKQLPDPGCCAGLVTVDLPGLPYAHLFTNCANSNQERNHTTIRCSFDDCVTWEKSIELDRYRGGYSDVAVDSKGKIYVLYETAYGRTMELMTMSFVDEFLKDEPAARYSTQTEFRFENADALKFVNKQFNTEVSVQENALRFTSTEDRRNGAVLNFTELTKNINLTHLQGLAMKIKVNSQKGGDFSMAVCVAAGRNDTKNSEKYNRISFPGDGNWHTVVVDFAKTSTEGRLEDMRLEFFTDSLKSAVGDTVEIEFFKFYPTAAEAYDSLGLKNPDDTGEPESTEPPSAETEPSGSNEKKGCGSAVSVMPFAAAAVLSAAAVTVRKKKSR